MNYFEFTDENEVRLKSGRKIYIYNFKRSAHCILCKISNFPKRSPRFSPGYEGTENMFYFLNRKPTSGKLV